MYINISKFKRKAFDLNIALHLLSDVFIFIIWLVGQLIKVKRQKSGCLILIPLFQISCDPFSSFSICFFSFCIALFVHSSVYALLSLNLCLSSPIWAQREGERERDIHHTSFIIIVSEGVGSDTGHPWPQSPPGRPPTIFL